MTGIIPLYASEQSEGPASFACGEAERGPSIFGRYENLVKQHGLRKTEVYRRDRKPSTTDYDRRRLEPCCGSIGQE